ncbi:MAG: hypothetical protein WAM60_13575 [Candidatus Promineifilaceae bacterium]
MNHSEQLWLSIIAITFSVLPPAGVDAGEGGSPYIDRALNLPALDADAECPISVGDNNVVSSEHAYIFGAGGYFFGSGPVYLALSWKPADRAEAWFELDPRTLTSDGYSLKTPWIMNPDYSGAALIRGARIGVENTQEILFQENTQAEPVTASMILRSERVGTLISSSQKRAVGAVWGFWPSSMLLSEPGCYAIQIDTEGGSDIVVFEAKAKS